MTQAAPAGEARHGVHTQVRGELGIVSLRRPPVNALDLAALQRLGEVLGDPVTWLPGARAVALVADGPHFSAGHDSAEQQRIHEPNYLADAAMHLREVLEAPLPVVAGVHGAAIGTGLILAACADVFVVAHEATLQLPEVPMGMLGGAGHLLRWLPPATVRHMVLLGAPMRGAELHVLGLVPPPEGRSATDHAIALASELAGRDGRASIAARDLLDDLMVDAGHVHGHEMARTIDIG